MPNPESELIKNLVSERLKLVDGLVRARKIDEAVKEITEIRKLDSKNPYALAYEERIRSLQQSVQSSPPQTPLTPPTPSNEFRTNASYSSTSDERSPRKPAEEEQATATSRDTVSFASDTPISAIRDSTLPYPAEPQKQSKGKGSILLIDDDVLLVQGLAEFLEDNRYSTTFFSRSEEALEYLKVNSPDLVICDVNIETSSFGGFTLHEKMRKFEHLRDVPFIFLSGLNDTAIILAGKELGADDYLTKPVEPEALLAVVKGKLKRYRQMKKNG